MNQSLIFKLDPSEQKILSIISEASKELNLKSYAIGGFIRDKIIGRISKDIDIVCIGDGILLAEHVASKLHPLPPVNVFNRFGTAMIKHQEMEIEFVGARKESYHQDSRKPTVFSGSLNDDQLRRDFTINAISISLNSESFGEILDPFNGLKDIEQKIIRTPNNPEQTFSDDPLRMLRAIRFANQLLYKIEDRTYEGIIQSKNRIKIVSRERITAELEKILACEKPSIGFDLLFRTGLLDLILPELALLHGAEYQNGKGHKDNFYHTLQVLDNLALKTQNIWCRWAAVFHDIAKPQTKRFDPEHGWTFHGHDALGANMIPKLFKQLRLPLDHKMKYVQKLVRLHLRPIALTQEEISDSALRRLLFEAGEDLEDLLLLCEADITSKNITKVNRYLNNYLIVREKLYELEERDRIRNWQPPVTGEDIMKSYNVKPGKEIGLIKTAIREAILDNQIPNTREAALKLMNEKAFELGLQKVQEV